MRIFVPEPRAPRAPLSASPDDVFLGALLVGSQTLVGLLDRSKKHEVCSNHLVDRSGRSGHRFHALGRRSRSMSGAAAENTKRKLSGFVRFFSRCGPEF